LGKKSGRIFEEKVAPEQGKAAGIAVEDALRVRDHALKFVPNSWAFVSL